MERDGHAEKEHALRGRRQGGEARARGLVNRARGEVRNQAEAQSQEDQARQIRVEGGERRELAEYERCLRERARAKEDPREAYVVEGPHDGRDARPGGPGTLLGAV